MADSSSSLTPEKRLLNLIESGGKGEAASSAETSQSPKAPKVSFKEKLSGVTEKARLFFVNFKNHFGLKSTTQAARVILAILVVLAITNALYEMKISGRDPLAGLEEPERKVTQIDFDEPLFDTGSLQSTESRNIFLPFSKREEMQSTKASNPSAGRLIELTKNLKLTGISYDPQDSKKAYCMIEDLQKNITLFLHIGDQVSGIKISKIFEESVEVEYENEKIEIH